MHALEKALVKATKLEAEDGENRQTFLKRLVDAAQDLAEAKWDKLPVPAQEWQVAGAKAMNKSQDIADFETEAEAEDEEEEDEEETTTKKKVVTKSEDEDEDTDAEDGAEASDEEESDETEAEDEEEVEASDDAEDEEEQDVEEKATKKKVAAKPAAKAKPAKAAKPEKTAKTNGAKPVKAAKAEKAPKPKKERKQGAQQLVKKLLIKDMDMSVDDLLTKTGAAGHKLSKMAVSSIRSGFRDSVRVLKDNGWPKPAI